MTDHDAPPDDENLPWWLTRGAIVVGVLATIELVAFAALRVVLVEPPPPPPPSPPMVTVVGGTGSVVDESGTAVAPGVGLTGRVLRVDSGTADLTMLSGVGVGVKGSSEFQVHSAMAMSFGDGTATVSVPAQAAGFTIITPSFRVVALAGSDFTLGVSDAVTTLAVTAGSVRMASHQADRLPVVVNAGQTATWSSTATKPTVVTQPKEP